jgi:hypothetical protein
MGSHARRPGSAPAARVLRRDRKRPRGRSIRADNGQLITNIVQNPLGRALSKAYQFFLGCAMIRNPGELHFTGNACQSAMWPRRKDKPQCFITLQGSAV